MKDVLVIGAGGIGSWLVPRLSRLKRYGQLNGVSEIQVWDFDIVENKNLKYQNFDIDDITGNKALFLEARFPENIIGKDMKVETEKDLERFDIIICAVDNAETRRLVFKHCIENDKYFIDLRAEGTSVWGVTSDRGLSMDELEKTLDDEGSSSCQREFELEKGIIQLGNTIIAEVGAQWLLNHMRNRKNRNIFTRNF